MQFQVPQFIEVEDKIFGPLTFRQFIYLLGGLGAAYIFYRVFPMFIAGPLILAVGGLAAALAFFQFNGRPFIIALENAFYFFFRSKLYLWSNDRKHVDTPDTKTVSAESNELYIPKLSNSKLHELSWSLDIQERIAAGQTNTTDRRESARVLGTMTSRDALVQ